MQIGLGIGIPFSKSQVWLAVQSFSPSNLFQDGTQGFWLDPSDLSTMFQDAAGTTPVTAVEQPVGLILDKRDLAYSTYFDGTGDRLTATVSSAIGTGDFTYEAFVYIVSFLTYNTVVGNRDNATNDLAQLGLGYRNDGVVYTYNAGLLGSPAGTVTTGVWYHIACSRQGSTLRIFVDGVLKATGTNSSNLSAKLFSVGGLATVALEPANAYISNARVVVGTALYTQDFPKPTAPLTPVAGTSLLTCGTSWAGNPAITRVGDTRADKINPFTTGTGNHAYQTVSTKRPVLSARVNLLTKTEQFGTGSIWTPYNSTIQDNTTDTLDPLGVNKAAKGIYAGIAAGCYYDTTLTGSLSYSVYAKKGTYDVLTILANATPAANATFNLTSGVSSGTNCTTAMVSVGNDWWKCKMTFSMSGSWRLINYFGTTTGHNLYLWGASLVPANQASLPYQRVNTATDYDTTGFPLYLRFDGIDDALQTNSIDFTATDKMFVCAGVRKLRDSQAASIVESGAWYTPGISGFSIACTSNYTPVNNYEFGLAGNSLLAKADLNYIAPITNVLSIYYDISGTAKEQEIASKINGVMPTNVAWYQTSAGTGYLSNQPIYIGAKAGSSKFFNGQLHQLVIVGKQASPTEITDTEQYVNSKTLAY